jgi:hypothetical protein
MIADGNTRTIIADYDIARSPSQTTATVNNIKGCKDLSVLNGARV